MWSEGVLGAEINWRLSANISVEQALRMKKVTFPTDDSIEHVNAIQNSEWVAIDEVVYHMQISQVQHLKLSLTDSIMW